MHFSLFVFACIDAYKWRKAGKIAKAEKQNFELEYNRSSSQQEQESREPPAYTKSDGTKVDEQPTKYV